MSLPVTLSKEEWEVLRDGFADISCWFMGFQAAYCKDGMGAIPQLPPQLNDVRSLIILLKERQNR